MVAVHYIPGKFFFSPLIKNPLDFLAGGSPWSKKSATFIQNAENSVNYILKEFLHYNFQVPLSV